MPESTKAKQMSDQEAVRAVWQKAKLDEQEYLDSLKQDKPAIAPPADSPPKEAPPAPTAIAPIKEPAPPPEKPAEPPAKAPEKPVEPPKPPEPAKEPAKPETDREPPRTSKAWESYKAADKEAKATLARERDEAKKQLEALAKERDAIKAEYAKAQQHVPAEELEPLRKEIESLREKIRVIDLEQDDQFRGYFDGETNSRIERAKTLVGAEKAGEIERLLRLPDSVWRDQQLEELQSDLLPLKQARLANLIEELAGVQATRESEKKKWKEKGSQLEIQKKAQEKESQDKARKQAELFLDQTIGEFSLDEKLKPYLSDDTARVVKGIILNGTTKPQDTVRLAIQGLAHDRIIQELNQAKQERNEAEIAWNAEKEELLSQIKSLQQAEPKAASPTPEASKTSKQSLGEFPKGLSPQALNDWWMKKAGQEMSD